MAEQVYVIVFDQLDPGFDPVALRDALRSDSAITHWWNHIPNCFLVTTGQSAARLTDQVKKCTGEVGFFVMQVDPSKSEGYLPDRSWDWIRKRERECSRATA